MACLSLPMTTIAPQSQQHTIAHRFHHKLPYSNSSNNAAITTTTPPQQHYHHQHQTTAAPSPRRNPYRVIKELGSGLQGRVLLALDEVEQQYVAVKVPSAFSSNNDGSVPSSNGSSSAFDRRLLEYQVQSLLLERRAQRLVDHENVLQYKRTVPGKKHGVQYAAVVMEYAPNGDLFDIIADTGALSIDAAKVYCQQLLRGLQACHAAGVVHRDIKPENLLLDERFTLKICDFGLAHVAPSDSSGSRHGRRMTTQHHDRCRRDADSEVLHDVSGTALYMAPEVSRDAPFRATPTDVWAAGVVLFILLTSFPPFERAAKGDHWFDCVTSGRMDVFWNAQTEPCIDAIDSDARDLISGMLCADPTKRLTIDDALQHPWLRDAHHVDRRRRVSSEMRARRQHSLRFGKHA